ncbi:terminase small subunit [Sulfitobacter mediterraneus]|uniref:terminase small subunit n=1 Tax=Sulfitobacter mediterraneus TaxID=83219 RepID=UPI0021A2AAAF|nr:terminase small subunit [Sulfitobacter mediterraneus]UWR10911.1 terminase small subunit [Sulfitobacter mediterraneus]
MTIGEIKSDAGRVKVLSDLRERFCLEFVKDYNATRAAIRAGYSSKTARSQAHRLLTNVDVESRIAQLRNEINANLKLEAEQVLQLNWTKATACVSELVQIQRGACRYCYGKGHLYQWRSRREFEQEYLDAAKMFGDGDSQVERLRNASEDLAALSDNDLSKVARLPGVPHFAGGCGYRKTKRPHRDCPECEGSGEAFVHISDTRDLSADGLSLFEGAKQTDKGIELKLADRGAAIDRVARALDLYSGGLQPAEEKPFAGLLADIQSGRLGMEVKEGRIPKNARSLVEPREEDP